MSAPLGAIVRIAPFDLDVDAPEPGPAAGDYLVTEAGRVYRVEAARHVRSTVHARRYALSVRVVARTDLPVGPRYFSLRWYPRGRR